MLETLDARVRSVCPETLDGAVNHARVGGFERVEAEREPLHLPRTVVFDDDVGLGDERQQQPAPALGLEVERQAALARVEYDEVEAVDVRRKRALAPRPVAHSGLLHLDDVRAQKRQQLRAGRARLHLRQVDYADSFQRRGHGRGVSVLTSARTRRRCALRRRALRLRTARRRGCLCDSRRRGRASRWAGRPP